MAEQNDDDKTEEPTPRKLEQAREKGDIVYTPEVGAALSLIAAGLIFRVGMGVLSRLIPQIQVFFVVLPLQIMGGLIVIALGLSTGMLIWLDSLERYATWLR